MQCTLRIVCTLWVYLKNYAMLFLEKYLCEKWSNFIYDDGFLFAMHHRTTFVEGWWKTNTNRNLLIRFDKEQMKEEKNTQKENIWKFVFTKSSKKRSAAIESVQIVSWILMTFLQIASICFRFGEFVVRFLCNSAKKENFVRIIHSSCMGIYGCILGVFVWTVARILA